MRLDVDYTKRRKFLVTEMRFTITDLPTAFENYTIVQLSDFHYGTPTALAHIEKAFALTLDLKPDLILLTGDYIQPNRIGREVPLARVFYSTVASRRALRSRSRVYSKELRALTEQLKVRHGLIGIYGNHDYMTGLSLTRRAFPADTVWLQNESAIINEHENSIQVIGIDDVRWGKPDVGLSFHPSRAKRLGSDSGAPENREPVFSVMLAHNPDFTLKSKSSSVEKVDLILCGHTHGGQICLPSGQTLLTRTAQRDHVKGLSYFHSVPLYTSSGIGFGGIAVRAFCPPELVVIKLARGK
jgi:uncharacterized protein